MAPYRQFLIRDMELALNAIRNGGMSMRSAAKNYGVPYVTLNRHLKGASKTFVPGRKPKLLNYESELKDAVVVMVDMGHGASKQDVMDLAAQTAEKAERSPFKCRHERPSDRWYRGFMKRQGLSLRQPENMSAARFRMATIQVKDEFFLKLREVLDKLLPLGLTAEQIYNTDETGLCVVTKSGKVVAPKGSKRVSARTGGERGENITAMVTVNAVGNHILPPTLIYRGKSLNFDLTDGAPEGTVFSFSKKSFIDSELFVEWFQRFINALPPPRPVLLLMDGHACHIQLKIIEMAQANGIHILCFPPHTTSYLQPLDVGVFKPLKSAFSQEASKLIRKNKVKHINRYHVARVLGSAWAKAITPMNIQGGFRGSGIWPFNPDAILLPGVDSALSTSSARPSLSALEQTPVLPSAVAGSNVTASVRRSLQRFMHPESTATESAIVENNTHIHRTPLQNRSSDNEEMSPVVQAVRSLLQPSEEVSSKPTRRVTTTRLITSDEFRKELEAKEAEKERKEREKRERMDKRKRATDKRTTVKNTAKKKKSAVESDLSDCDSPSEPGEDSDSNDSVGSEDNEKCGICMGSFQNDFQGEQWIQCNVCKVWFHLACLHLEEYDPNFSCDDCIPLTKLRKK